MHLCSSYTVALGGSSHGGNLAVIFVKALFSRHQLDINQSSVEAISLYAYVYFSGVLVAGSGGRHVLILISLPVPSTLSF